MKQIASPDVKGLKDALKASGVTYQKVADTAGVSWHFVYCVVNRKKKSARVSAVIESLIADRRVA